MARVLEVTSVANPRVKSIAALAMKKERSASGLFVVEGLQLVGFGVEAGWELMTLVINRSEECGTRNAGLLGRIYDAAGDVLEVSAAVMAKLSRKDNPQGVLGVFRQRTLELAGLGIEGVWVVLEQIRDPGNLGTIVRTVDAVGAQGVILLGDCTDVWAPECVRATMGSIFHVPVVKASVEAFLKKRNEERGSEVARALMVGTHLHGAVDYRAVPPQRPLLLCMGTEQSGLSEALTAACDLKIKIPMRGRAESLNLAIATGVALYALAGD